MTGSFCHLLLKPGGKLLIKVTYSSVRGVAQRLPYTCPIFNLTKSMSKPTPSKVPRGDFEKEDDWVTVYVDGACSANGTLKAKAGLGVWFYANCLYNLSEPVRGRKTNNVAEIEAAIRSIEQAHAAGINKLRIKTDSMFLINCVTVWRFSWMKKNWMTAAGKPVINKTDIITLVDVMENLAVEVDWVHVKAHKGTIGNEAADFLARQGAEKSV